MDWPKIIQDLQDAGYSQKQIAEYCHCSQGLISQIKNKYKKPNSKGRTAVSFDVGNALLKLHASLLS
ncbi:MAG: XRE family transcriptional regulator [Neisseria sp.]|jgi:DNA-binding helix-turn-helix protein|uniref:helix-turn-helix domain-containing protein n=1 Tax=Neisseria mucosa TaxID=488 RepID=UPI0009E26AD8|nr:helix-turn-helix transcriptional regulator [Neisseria mucosa]RKV73949.1 MAG: XRE family transcriptional regulator [Neisseria sp.]